MRLTLRSLLGYLDDILEPQQTKELGEKISESGFAASLVARIREVVRRRRITAPEVAGPGSDPDPNVVSEYLDNTLAPEKVEDLERLCLESDVHLAEVASSHQILTMVLGEPVEIPQSTRERMYSLGAVSDGSTAPRAAASVAPTTPSVPAASAAPAPTVPEYLTRGTAWRRVIPSVAALLVVGVWLGLIFSDPTMKSWRFWEPQSAPESSLASSNTAVPKVESEPAAAATESGEALVDATPSAAVATVTSGNVPTDGNDGTAPIFPATDHVNPPPRADATAIAAIAPSAGVTPAELPESPTTNSPSTPGTAATAAPGTEAPAAPVIEPKLMYNAPEGVLLRHDSAEGWIVLPRRTLLHSGDDLACPEPFESSVQILDSDCEIVLAGGARATILPGDGDTPNSLRIDRGRFIFRRSASAPLPETTSIALHLDDRAFILELLTPGSECGLEVIRQTSAGPSDRPQAPSFDGGLSLTAGSVRLTPVEGAPLTLDSSTAFLQFVDGRALVNLQPLFTPPAWMNRLSGGAAVVAQQFARRFEEEFLLGTPIDATIPPLVEDRDPRHSEFATKALALVDNFRGMVRALSAPHQESRQAALVGLGTWIRRDPGNPLRLAEELDRMFDAETAAVLMKLVWGFGPVDAQTPATSELLVDWLGDSNVAVREGAFFHILRLTGGQITYRYHPDRSESQRAMSVKQWQGHLKKLGALAEPGPTPIDQSAETAPPLN